MTFPSLGAGQLLAGRYRITEPLGAGEIGEVYAAVDQHGDRECAVKILIPQILGASAAFSAFQEACRSVSSASTEAIARVTDFGVDANSGRPFFATERIGFPSVAEIVQTRGPIPVPAWVDVFDLFARSVEAAARLSVPHGDLKPQNLFFSLEHPGWARVSDFGVAGLRAAIAPDGMPVALGWAAPEQMSGAPASRASDVFSLALVTFYALTGRHYLRAMWQRGATLEAVRNELLSPHPSASEHATSLGATLPSSLDAWFAQALNLEPANRFASALEAFTAFQTAFTTASMNTSEPALGVAAAIAKPLVFQDLPPRPAEATLAAPVHAFRDPPGLGGTMIMGGGTMAYASTAEAAPVLSQPVEPSVPAFGAAVTKTRDDPPAGAFASSPPASPPPATVPRKPPLALLAAAGFGALLLLTLGSWAALRLFSPKTPKPDAGATAPIANTTQASANALGASPALAPAASDAQATRARFSCIPESCEWIVCDGKNIPKGTTEIDVTPGRHTCSASRYGYRTAVIEFAAHERQTAIVEFELLATRGTTSTPSAKAQPAATPPSRLNVTAAKPAPTAAKPAPTAAKPASNVKSIASSKVSSASVKPVPTTQVSAKTTAKTSVKPKKCGTFINPCR